MPSSADQKNGSTVGTPVEGLALKLMKDMPATSPRSLLIHAPLSGPPKVCRSRIKPFCQTNACVSVAPGTASAQPANVNSSQKIEGADTSGAFAKGSGVLVSAPPTT